MQLSQCRIPLTIAAASLLGVILWRRLRGQRRAGVGLPSVLEAGLYRSAFQLRERWKIGKSAPCNPSVVLTIRQRAAASDDRGVQVHSKCRCGACRVVVTHGGPLYTTVCHCSLCRAHNFREGNVSMPFAAVRRSACVLQVTQSTGREPFVWLQTSDLVRRGRCALCGSAVLFDQERFEPNTMWLVNPTISVPGSEDAVPAAAFDYWRGQHDADVCWASRHVPVPADVFGARADFGDFFGNETSSAAPTGADTAMEDDGLFRPRGARQFHDIDWSYYFVDPGQL